jgi:transcriptional regulator with XRE-family HTH domain
MTESELWWKKLTARVEKDPVFIAEGIAIDIAMQVNDSLEERGIAQKELAQRLGVSQAYVSQILGGKTNLTILTLCKVAAALGLQPFIKLEESISKNIIPFKCATDAVEMTRVASIASAAATLTETGLPAASERARECRDSTASTCAAATLTA